MTTYEELLKEVRIKLEAFNIRTAKKYIPELWEALKNEYPNLTREDLRDKIEKDCLEIWSERRILEALPDEAKDPKKQKFGRLSQKKRISAVETAAPYAKKKEILIDTEGNTIKNDAVLTTSLRSTIDDHPFPQFDNENKLHFEFCIPSKYVLEHLFLAENTVDQICFNVVLDKHTGEVISSSIPDD
ncbi:MAG TPA: hypothetical protein VFI73_05740 [Candidatus Nitrosopolaris sp.]|nr:hypothetical protein [Candidatus Nitrosopolaris sp.]